MPTLISLKPKDGRPWQSALGLEAGLLSTATLDELAFSAEDSRIHLTLRMASVPEDGLGFAALRKALAGLGHPRLKVRYPEGALTPQEYLALHFEDLLSALKD